MGLLYLLIQCLNLFLTLMNASVYCFDFICICYLCKEIFIHFLPRVGTFSSSFHNEYII